jgi:aspartyl/asparaginyl beta-hydroxylase (cupin superfamily)
MNDADAQRFQSVEATADQLRFQLRDRFPPQELKRVDALLTRAASVESPRIVNPWQSVNARMFVPGLTAQAWHDPSKFPIVPRLERNVAKIRAEMRTVFDDESLLRDGVVTDLNLPAREASGNPLRGSWRAYHLHRGFRPVPSALARCPTTASALAGEELSREAMFSLLGPGTHIATHSDGVNAVVTVYLPLIVPQGAWIRFGDQAVHWTEGRCVAADSTFQHDSRNPGPGWRAVLIVDLWHPELTAIERRALAFAFPILDEALTRAAAAVSTSPSATPEVP